MGSKTRGEREGIRENSASTVISEYSINRQDIKACGTMKVHFHRYVISKLDESESLYPW